MSTDKQQRLGRGLDALLASGRASPSHPAAVATTDGEQAIYRRVAIAHVRANPMQPRREFDEARLEELSVSLRDNGLLQPITVRKSADGFELIAGERRLRAAQRLGWKDIPAIVRDDRSFDGQSLLALALVENLQRADLNPIEEAEGYQKLVSDFSLTQHQVAEIVGRERSTVANLLRLLALPDAVRDAVRQGALSVGHARALLAVTDVSRLAELAQTTIAEGLSVREVERRAREMAPPKTRTLRKAAAALPQSADVREIEGELRKRFQTDVAVRLTGASAGEVRISFYSADDLERLLELLLRTSRPLS